MLDELTEKVALVTGASRGIGKAIAIALAAAGANVALNYRERQEEAGDTRAEIEKLGRRCLCVPADVSAAAEVERLIRKVESELGPVAILVNNAGVTRHTPRRGPHIPARGKAQRREPRSDAPGPGINQRSPTEA